MFCWKTQTEKNTKPKMGEQKRSTPQRSEQTPGGGQPTTNYQHDAVQQDKKTSGRKLIFEFVSVFRLVVSCFTAPGPRKTHFFLQKNKKNKKYKTKNVAGQENLRKNLLSLRAFRRGRRVLRLVTQGGMRG